MKLTIRLQTFLLTLLLNFVAYSADAQTYVRYVKPEDLSTKVVYADSALPHPAPLPLVLQFLSNQACPRL